MYLLNSGGKDSNFCSLFFKKNIFIDINNNCFNFIDKKYSYFNCLIIKKNIFFINLKKEYNFIFNNFKNTFFNIDYYCNVLLKINLLLLLLNIKVIISGHYIKKIKKIFFYSNDEKKDQSYFLNFKKNFFSINGFFNKKNIIFFSFKKKFICYNKKNTVSNCFKNEKKNFFFYFILFENVIVNFCFSNILLNLGKIFFKKKIIKTNFNQIFTGNNFLIKIFELKKKIKKKIIRIKINSQNIKKIGKFILLKKKKFIIFYKKHLLETNQNVLISYNDLLILNFKIKKKY